MIPFPPPRLGREAAIVAALEIWAAHGRKGHPVVLHLGDRPQTGPKGGILKPVPVFDVFLCCVPAEQRAAIV